MSGRVPRAAVVIGIALMSLMGAAGAVLASRSTGVLELQGRRLTGMLLVDVVRIVVTAAVTVVGGVAVPARRAAPVRPVGPGACAARGPGRLRDDSTTADEGHALDRRLGSWLLGRERAGDAMLVRQGVLAEVLTTDPGASPGEGDALSATPLLTVDSTYLAREPLRAADGTTVVPDPDAALIQVLVPEGLQVDTDALVEGVHSTVEGYRQFRETFGGDPASTGVTYDVSVVRTLADQESFVYSTITATDPPTVTGAVVVVYPSGLPVLDYDTAVSLMSQRSFLVDGLQGLVARARRDGVAHDLATIRSPAQINRSMLADALADLAVRQVTVAASGAAVLVTMVGFALVHVRRHRERIFACTVHGWSFPARHWGLLTVHATVMVVLVGSTAVQTYQERTRSALFFRTALTNAPDPRLFVVAGAVCVALLATSVALAARSAVQERSAE